MKVLLKSLKYLTIGLICLCATLYGYRFLPDLSLNGMHIEFRASFETPTIVQIFYDSGNSYNEESSSRYEILENKETVIRAFISEKEIKSIRIDPSTHIGEGYLESIQVRYKKGLWQSVDMNELLSIQHLVIKKQNSRILEFESIAGDPILILTDIPKENSFQRVFDLNLLYSLLIFISLYIILSLNLLICSKIPEWNLME